MGRREIWSDSHIQNIASQYVCVIEETFFLYPPAWLKNPPNPASTKLFKTYTANAPAETFPERTSTYQGLYCLMPDGRYLSGKFARQTRDVAKRTLLGGLKKWQEITQQKSLHPKAVPTNKLAMYGGDPLKKNGIKLEVVYRDLPRGNVKRPGNAQFPNPYNLGWFDFTPTEAKSFRPSGKEKTALPDSILRKLARTRLKDAVRGQMSDWKEGALQEGTLYTQLVSKRDGQSVYQLTGSAVLESADQSFKPEFFGFVRFNEITGEFADFRLLASGQRTGKGPANGRATDLGPAPMAVSLTLYRE